VDVARSITIEVILGNGLLESSGSNVISPSS